MTIFSFPTLFSKDMNCRHIKTRACLGQGYGGLTASSTLSNLRSRKLSNSAKSDILAIDQGLTLLCHLIYRYCVPLTSGRSIKQENRPVMFDHSSGIDLVPYQAALFPVLTHYQTTNFRLFQTKKICRRQFQI